MIPQIAFFVNVVAGAIGAYTDIKTGYIYDWITYPLIAIGIILTILTQQWIGLLFAALIYGLGWVAYRSGKMGGGDIKLLAGVALVQPTFEGMVFPLAVLLIGALSACMVFCVYYVGGFLLSKPKIHWNTPRKKGAGILLAAFILLFLYMNTQLPSGGMTLILLEAAMILGLIFYAFEEEVKKHAFLKRIPLSELEEDEVLAIEHLTKEEKEKWGTTIPDLISREDIPALKHKGLSTIPVYRNLPKFAPFLLIGILATYLFPEWVSQIVPSFL